MTKTEQNILAIKLLDAVQGNAGVGLTRGDIDDILRLGFGERGSVAFIADFIAPGWRSSESPDAQNDAINRAVRIYDAVNSFDQEHPRPAGFPEA